MASRKLLDDADHLASANGTTTFADSELKTFVHCNRSDELNGDFHVIARHNHLYTLGEHDLTGNVEITVKLITPVAMNEGQQFAIREGGRTVGAGQVIKIIE